MNVLRGLPIRRQITVLIMLTTAGALIFAFSAGIGLSYLCERSQLQNETDVLAQVLAENTAAGLLFKDPQSSGEILSGLRVHPAIVGAAVYSKDGMAFVRYRKVPPGRLSVVQAGAREREDEVVESYRPIVLRGERLGTLYVASNLDELRSFMHVQITISLTIVAVSLLLALLMAAGLRRLVTRPFIALAAAAQRVIREQNYAVRMEMNELAETDELHRVTLAFNEMLSQIELRDETLQRHQANLERQVEARTSELRMILNAAGDGIFGLDAAGRLTFMNPSAARMLGCDAASLIGTTCSASVELPVGARAEAVFRRSDGRQIPVEYTSSTILDDERRPSGVVVMFRDITERRAVERMKDEFVSTVSHELRTPLTSIRGALGLLGSGMVDCSSPKGRRMLDIALANTERLVRLINDILDLEKMSAGKVELNRKIVSTDDLVHESVEELLSMAERANVRIEVRASAAPVSVDADRVHQLLVNLLSNALKFSLPGTQIRVDGRVDGGEYVVSVHDQGRGIPEDKLEMIFERFQQVDASDSRDKGGTGLGLAICRSIAEAHGGRIWAERAEPQGTIFHFTLPLSFAEAASAT